MKLQSKVRGVRGLLGLTQDELAAEAGVDRSEISRFENGKNRLSESATSRLITVLTRKLKVSGMEGALTL
jgi:transcriptional regulator with XRE-family HTH domain